MDNKKLLVVVLWLCALAMAATTVVNLATQVSGILGVSHGGTGTASTLTGIVRGSGSAYTGSELSGDVATSGSNATTIQANAVTSAKLAVANTRRICQIDVGADNAGSVLVDLDLGPQKRQCFIPYAAHIVEVDVTADSGTPSVLLQRRRGNSTVADLLSGVLASASSGNVACALTGTSGTCIDGTTSSGSVTLSNTALSAGDYVELKTGGVAGGAAKSVQVAVVYTVD